MLENLYRKGKLKHTAGFVRNLLECVASMGIRALICLTPQHTDSVSINGKKVFKMIRAGVAGTEQTNKDKKGVLTWRKMHHC